MTKFTLIKVHDFLSARNLGPHLKTTSYDLMYITLGHSIDFIIRKDNSLGIYLHDNETNEPGVDICVCCSWRELKVFLKMRYKNICG